MAISTLNKVLGGALVAGAAGTAVLGNQSRSESGRAKAAGEQYLAANRDDSAKGKLIAALGIGALGVSLLHGSPSGAANDVIRFAGAAAAGLGGNMVMKARSGKAEAIEGDRIAAARAEQGGAATEEGPAAVSGPSSGPTPIDMATAFRLSLGSPPEVPVGEPGPLGASTTGNVSRFNGLVEPG